MPGTILATTGVLVPSVSICLIRQAPSLTHFTDEETEVQRGHTTYLGHIAGKGRSSLAPDLILLTRPIFPSHQAGTEALCYPKSPPLTPPHPSHPKSYLTFTAARASEGAGSELSGFSQMNGLPPARLSFQVSSRWTQTYHNQQPGCSSENPGIKVWKEI